jgi:hypothetical protein
MRIVKNGDVHVSAPIGLSKKKVLEFINAHRSWIIEARKRTEAKVQARRAFYNQLPLTTRRQTDEAKAKLKAKPDGGKTVTRYLKLESGKTAMVGSGEAVTVNFKIKKGSFNWDPQDPEVTYYFKYDGKTYQAKAYPAWHDSAYKSGKYWWLTYIDDEADLYNYYL